MRPLNDDLIFVTFDPEMDGIRWLIVTHPIAGHYVATIIVATEILSRFSKLCRNIFPLAFNHPTPTEGFPSDGLCKIFRGCQRMAKEPNGVKTFPKISTG